jgi:predicted dehydrogenase
METTKIGIVGCGNVSGIYFKAGTTFDILEVAACADIDMDKARAKAAPFRGVRAVTVGELLADPAIEIVINLTVPKAHAEVAAAAIEAGKHVHNEKPLAVTRQEARGLLAAAAAKGLRVGCAPDTFLGAGLQTCRKLIDEGRIGRPVAAAAFMMCPGHEHWHPDPEFLYQAGGGPMFDMGPYYVTALVALLGPARRVTGSVASAYDERVIGSGPKRGTRIPVETPTHVAGVVEFAGGAVASIVTSFDVWNHSLPRIEIYGTEATLSVPDPNTFGGPVAVRTGREKQWQDVPLAFGYAENSRGIGVADMACALRSARAHRTSGRLAYHVLDVMHAFHDASRTGRHVEITSGVDRPAPLPEGLREGALDE